MVCAEVERSRNGEISIRIVGGEATDVGGWLAAAKGMGSAELARRMGVTVRQAQRVLAGEASTARVRELMSNIEVTLDA